LLGENHFNINIVQNSIATYLRCGGNDLDNVADCKLTIKCASENKN